MRTRIFCVLAILAAIGCGGNQPYDPSTGGGGGGGAEDFAIGPVTAQTVEFGNSATYNLTVTQVGNGTARPVTITVTGLPSYAAATVSPNPVTPTPTGAGTTATIATDVGSGIKHRPNSVRSPGPGTATFPVTFTGTDGVHTHSQTANMSVTDAPAPDWTFGEVPSQNFVIGFGVTVPIRVTLTNPNAIGVEPVNLSVVGASGTTTASISPAAVTPTATGATATLMLNVAAPSLTRGQTTITGSVTVFGNDGTNEHSVVVNYTAVPGPSWSISQLSDMDVTQGSTSTQSFTVTLNGPPVNNQTRPVHLSLTGAPTGITATFTPNPVTPTQAGVSSVKKITCASSVPDNDYQVQISGTDGLFINTSNSFFITVNLAGGQKKKRSPP